MVVVTGASADNSVIGSSSALAPDRLSAPGGLSDPRTASSSARNTRSNSPRSAVRVMRTKASSRIAPSAATSGCRHAAM
jgi:hypothetical protein